MASHKGHLWTLYFQLHIWGKSVVCDNHVGMGTCAGCWGGVEEEASPVSEYQSHCPVPLSLGIMRTWRFKRILITSIEYVMTRQKIQWKRKQTLSWWDFLNRCMAGLLLFPFTPDQGYTLMGISWDHSTCSLSLFLFKVRNTNQRYKGWNEREGNSGTALTFPSLFWPI